MDAQDLAGAVEEHATFVPAITEVDARSIHVREGLTLRGLRSLCRR